MSSQLVYIDVLSTMLSPSGYPGDMPFRQWAASMSLDAMAAARKAGAPGGTILKARGTASGEDAQFFGLTLFPEKEVLLMLVPGDKAEAVRQAVKEADCLKNPGMGIAFSASVDDFFSLGKI